MLEFDDMLTAEVSFWADYGVYLKQREMKEEVTVLILEYKETLKVIFNAYIVGDGGVEVAAEAKRAGAAATAAAAKKVEEDGESRGYLKRRTSDSARVKRASTPRKSYKDAAEASGGVGAISMRVSERKTNPRDSYTVLKMMEEFTVRVREARTCAFLLTSFHFSC
jgi:hypothetical protein